MRKKLLLLGATFALLPIVVFSAETINWTFYAPGAAGKMQGGGTTAHADASGRAGVLHTLDDIRRGASPYVTIASANVMKGRWYCIGTVTYTSPIDRQTHTLQNVVGYVHDTGCAFNGTCSCGWLPQFCNGRARTDKMDIAVGNFSGWGAGQAAMFVTKNPNRAPAVWQQIAGLPNPGYQSSSGGACNGIAQETGVPSAAPFSPNSIADPYSTFNPYSAYGNTGMQPGSPGIPGTFQPMNAGQVMGSGMPNFIGQSVNIGSSDTDAYGDPNGQSSGTGAQTGPPGPPEQNIVVWPETIARGGTVQVSWTSVNMNKNSCQVLFEGAEFAKANEGTKPFQTVSSDTSTITFTLECNDANGKPYQSSDSATIQ